MSERPIFVAGFQRSGTTMLQSILGRHPRIAAAPELYYWLRVFMIRDQLGSLDDDTNLERIAKRAVNVPMGLWDGAGVTVAAVMDRMRGADRDYGSLLNALMSEFAARQGKPRWAEKTPGQQVSECFAMVPEAQVVHIVRRVDDVVASNLAMPWQRRSAHAIASGWAEFNTKAMRDGIQAGPDRYLRVRYEDLLRSPDRVVRLICTFLDEDFDPRMLESNGSSAVSEIGRDWQGRAEDPVSAGQHRRLSRYDQLQMVAAAGQATEVFGYRHTRRDQLLGRIVGLTAVPERLREGGRRRLRGRRMARNPSARVAAVDDFIENNRLRLERNGQPTND